MFISRRVLKYTSLWTSKWFVNLNDQRDHLFWISIQTLAQENLRHCWYTCVWGCEGNNECWDVTSVFWSLRVYHLFIYTSKGFLLSVPHCWLSSALSVILKPPAFSIKYIEQILWPHATLIQSDWACKA